MLRAQQRERLHCDTCLCIVAGNIKALTSEVEVKIEFTSDTLTGDISEMTTVDFNAPVHKKMHLERSGLHLLHKNTESCIL